MDVRRWTPLVMLFPHRYVDEDGFWTEFDLEEWSTSTYSWTADPWNGFRDVVKRPRTTVREGVGDCEDYALVVASWAVTNGRSGVGIGFCWERPYPWPRHVISFDSDRVYSSGNITRESVAEYLSRSKYDHCLRRSVT